MNYTEIIDDIFSRQRAGIRPGLKRTLALLKELGNPHHKLKCIHIAGTNGKGTCSSLLASYYHEKGKKVGLYTSPHLLEFNERIRINGVKIPNSFLIEKYLILLDKINKLDATFFEITTVIAFQYFAENNCDICIIETGMGGRFDCTNVITPILSIITSISIDHKDFLGDTLEKIAFEKAGIIKNNIPVILGNIKLELEYIFKEKAKENNSILYKLNKILNSQLSKKNNRLIKISEYNFNSYWHGNNNKFQTNLLGKHNEININLIKNSLEILNDYDEDLFIKSINNLSKNTGYFGRLSILNSEPYIIIDTGHNQEALEYLIDTVKANTKDKFNVVYTGMADKDNKLNLGILKEITNKLYLTKSSVPRNEKVENLGKIAEELDYNNIILISDLEECVNNVLEENYNTLFVGSFFLIGEVINILKNKNYGDIGLGSLSTL